MAGIDRIETLGDTDAIVGIDFVYVNVNQTTLLVFFHPAKTMTAQQILGPILPEQILIFSPTGGESLPEVPLDPASPPTWVTEFGRRVLRVKTKVPGDFSRYRFRLISPLVDPYFNDVGFSFKANCPSELDCEQLPHECPGDELVDYPVNYLARDFWSIRQALLDFASERHPAWKDRLEADLGMMLAEVMSALGDEFAYYQDRISRESYFESATQRRSLRRQARLVDYHLNDGRGGSTWLDFTVDATAPVHKIDVGTPVWVPPAATLPGDTPVKRRARSPSIYEVGHGIMQGHKLLNPPLAIPAWKDKVFKDDFFNLRNAVNELKAHQWDENDACLLIDSTFMYVEGHHKADLPLEDFTNPDVSGKWVVLKTNPADASIPVRTHLVRLIKVDDEIDPLSPDVVTGVAPANITRLEWEEAQALPFEMELESLVVRGNIVPATAGETLEAFFDIEPNPQAASLPPLQPPPEPSSNTYFNENFSSFAVERSARLFSLPGSEERNLVMYGTSKGMEAPEIRLLDGERDLLNNWADGDEWEWKRSMLGTNSSLKTDKHFTLEDGSWRRVAGYRRVDETQTLQEFAHFDYAESRGATVQFGNGEFGDVPPRATKFRAVYRLGRGRGDNVAAGSLTEEAVAFVTGVTNPFDVIDALDPETADQARHVAPQAFRAETFRAVREEDYAAAVEKLDWVQRAGAQFRWTGSWLTLFATPDPKDSFSLSPVQRRELERQLDRYRLAGRETHGMNPKFANLDLEIHVCVAPTSYLGEVKAAVLEALFGKRGVRRKSGFFSPDNWTFGNPLDRARLEAAIQAVPGVRAVEEIYIRRRSWFARRLFNELVYKVAADEIIRVENNPDLPERGAVRLVMRGGA